VPDPDKKHWVDLYRMAMMALENAQVAGRIGDAQIEIAARLEKLDDPPELSPWLTFPGIRQRRREPSEESWRPLLQVDFPMASAEGRFSPSNRCMEWDRPRI
jgi:hypothetical protein